jgi:hypothetical protein
MLEDVSFKDLIVGGTALAGFGAALLGYQKVCKEAAHQALALSRVVIVDDKDVRRKPWNVAVIRWVGIAAAVAACSYGAFNLSDPSGVVLVGEGAMFALLFGTMRTKPPSRVRKCAQVVVSMPASEAARLSLAAAQSLGARIGQFDADAGVLVASTGVTWRSFGEIIAVRVTARDPATSEISLESDAVEPSAFIDWGANARNIQRMKAALSRGASA